MNHPGFLRRGALLFALAAFLGCRRWIDETVFPAQPLPLPLSALHPIDGVVDFTAFAGVQQAVITFSDFSAVPVKTTTVRWVFANDDLDLYLAVEWTDDTFNNAYTIGLGPTDFDAIQLRIDSDADGTFELGEDQKAVVAATVGSNYNDGHQVVAGDDADLVGDGLGRLKYDATGQKYQAEFLFPRAADVQGEDAAVTTSTRWTLAFLDHLEPALATGNAAYLHGSATDSSAWPTVPLADSVPTLRPSLPGGLGGLIAFVSSHEEAAGEIYTFAPATGAVVRVTNNSLYEDCISLSHDRTRIAYHGAPTPADYLDYEIYRVNVDGTGLVQLTTNAILDGHPGWSPDDSTIAYASFREFPSASIVTMNSSTGVEIADLTPPGFDENDPDWTPDGRIVFKTDRYSVFPEVRIAVMNADGSGLLQLTAVGGTSDHDPIADGTYAIFERFLKGTNYSTDPESLFTPWPLVEARLDGTGERTVLSDGWINWLPIYDPSKQYVLHLKSVGYTDIRLITRAGQDLGRFVPNMTKVRYLDWK